MKGKRCTVNDARQEAVDFLMNHCDSCVVSEDMRTLSFQNVEVTKSLCKITNRYSSCRDAYGNVYNYFSISSRDENGVLTLTTAVLTDAVAPEIEKLYNIAALKNKKTK
jgi:hypothetical protein